MPNNINFVRDPSLEEEMYQRLRDKYLNDRTKEIHVSDTINCLTKSYFEKTSPRPPTHVELLYFSVGFALEEVILRDGLSPTPESYEICGMFMSPDYIVLSGGEMDLKSTRMWADTDGIPKKGWPEHWIKQFLSYSYRLLKEGDEYVDYGVGIVYIASSPPKLVAGKFRFTRDEIIENLAVRLMRKDILETAITAGSPPTPFEYNEDWECNNCRYADRCTSIIRGDSVYAD